MHQTQADSMVKKLYEHSGLFGTAVRPPRL